MKARRRKVQKGIQRAFWWRAAPDSVSEPVFIPEGNMESLVQLEHAKAFRERCRQALKNNAEFALYKLTPSGSGKAKRTCTPDVASTVSGGRLRVPQTRAPELVTATAKLARST